jgi:hypothetical protein
MADNGTHVWVATGGKLYAARSGEILEIANGFGFTDVAYQDGYLIGVVRGTEQWMISAIDDATTIDALDFTSADTSPDNLVGIISDHRELLAFGESTIEAYYNSGASAFPFARTQVVERGCVSAASIAKAQNSVYWLGDDLMVYRMAGYQPEPISTPPIVGLIADQSSPQTAQGYCYQQGGHTFYVLTFSDLTVCYDLSTGLWHRRRSDGIDRWRANSHEWCSRWRKNIVGDYSNGKLYDLDLDTYDEDGGVLRARAVGAPLWNGGHRLIIDEFFLDIEAGVGLVSGQGSDPQAVLDWSSDGGATWSAELWRSFGKIGERQATAKWRALGAHRNWTPRVTITDPVKRHILGASARIERLSA